MSAFSKYVLLASVTHVGENTAGIIRGNNNHATRGILQRLVGEYTGLISSEQNVGNSRNSGCNWQEFHERTTRS